MLSEVITFSAFVPEGTILTLVCCAYASTVATARIMNMKILLKIVFKAR